MFLVISAIISAFISFRYGLKIKFGPIDDHEIFRFLGSKQEIKLLDIPNILWSKTEIGTWGKTARYRPSYYTIRVLETKIFGANPTLWYGLRLISVALVSYVLTSVALQLAGLKRKPLIAACGVISILTVLSLNSWTEVILRLGPSEFYLVVGYALFLYFLLLNIQKPSFSLYLALFVSLIVVVGSKENGIALLLPFLLLTVYLLQQKVLSRSTASILGFLAVVYSAFVFLGPLIFIKTSGADVYGNKRSISESMKLGLDYIKSSEFQKLFSLVLVILLCTLLQRNHEGESPKFAALVPLISGFFVLQIILEQIFYKGNFGEPRYALITEISKTLLYLIAIFSALGLITDILSKRRLRAVSVSLTLILLSFPATYSNYKTSISNNQKIALSKVESTRTYQEKIESIVQAIDNRSSENVVIQMNNIWDYEPAYAIIKYLQYYSKGSNFYLNLQIPPVQPGLETILLAQLSDYQLNGSEVWNVKPRPTELGSNNFCITFNGAAGVLGVCQTTFGA